MALLCNKIGGLLRVVPVPGMALALLFLTGQLEVEPPYFWIFRMANHASAKKRIRSSAKKRLLNRYKKKSCVTFLKKLSLMTDKAQAELMLRKVVGMIDRLTNKHIIHLNKSSRLKAQLTKRVNAL